MKNLHHEMQDPFSLTAPRMSAARTGRVLTISWDYAHSPGKGVGLLLLLLLLLAGRRKYKICSILPNYLKIIPPVHLDISNNIFISCILFINEEFQFLGKMARLVNGKIEQQKPIFE